MPWTLTPCEPANSPEKSETNYKQSKDVLIVKGKDIWLGTAKRKTQKALSEGTKERNLNPASAVQR